MTDEQCIKALERIAAYLASRDFVDRGAIAHAISAIKRQLRESEADAAK